MSLVLVPLGTRLWSQEPNPEGVTSDCHSTPVPALASIGLGLEI